MSRSPQQHHGQQSDRSGPRTFRNSVRPCTNRAKLAPSYEPFSPSISQELLIGDITNVDDTLANATETLHDCFDDMSDQIAEG